MDYVSVADVRGELNVECDDALIGPLHDQVHLVVAIAGSQMVNDGLGSLGVRAHAQGDERLEERAEQRPRSWHGRSVHCVLKQRWRVSAEESRGERGICEIVLGARGQPAEGVAGWKPSGHVVKQPQLR